MARERGNVDPLGASAGLSSTGAAPAVLRGFGLPGEVLLPVPVLPLAVAALPARWPLVAVLAPFAEVAARASDDLAVACACFAAALAPALITAFGAADGVPVFCIAALVGCALLAG